MAPKTSSEELFRSARAVDHGCVDAIRACAAMMDAAESIGAYPELCAIREAIVRLHLVASGVLKETSGTRQI
ncbi:hypothetical protein P3T18_001145 [Paraburkholderia sp. GAS199]